MTTYTVAMATYYNNTWHVDAATESAHMTERAVIMCGRELASRGAFPLYMEYVNNEMVHYMVEYNGSLECAYGMQLIVM